MLWIQIFSPKPNFVFLSKSRNHHVPWDASPIPFLFTHLRGSCINFTLTICDIETYLFSTSQYPLIYMTVLAWKCPCYRISFTYSQEPRSVQFGFWFDLICFLVFFLAFCFIRIDYHIQTMYFNFGLIQLIYLLVSVLFDFIPKNYNYIYFIILWKCQFI